MANPDKPKGPKLVGGRFNEVWGKASGLFARHQVVIPGAGEGEARTPDRVKITDLQTDIRTDVGFREGGNIQGFQGSSSMVSSFEGGGAENGLPFNIARLQATFQGTVAQEQIAEGKNLVESHLTAGIIKSEMTARGVSGMGQLHFAPAPGVGITVVSGREISETEE